MPQLGQAVGNGIYRLQVAAWAPGRHALAAKNAVQDSGMGLSDLTAAGGVPKGGKGTPEVTAPLRQLLWEQRQMNIMMWATLSPEQREEVTLYTDHARARWSEGQDPRLGSGDT